MWNRLFVAILALGAMAGPAAAERITNDEYGISVVLPEGGPVCWGESGTHVHGVGTRLDGADCEVRSGPLVSVWSDYNSAFLRDARERLRHDKRCAGAKSAWATGEWRRSVGGLKTAFCRYQLPDGSIEVTLVAQTGRWESGFGIEETKAPSRFHTLRLRTTVARYDRDLAIFRVFVKSIRLDEQA